jgi:FkbM family methyltransferase
MGLVNTIRFVLAHPLNRGRPVTSLLRAAAWQVRSRLSRAPRAVPFVNDTRLLVSRGQTGATGNVYAGLHEVAEMAFVLHVLRPDDLFVDVGANVGSYTILASVTGASVVAFEPGIEAYNRLCANVTMNDLGPRVIAMNEAVGATVGEVTFTTGADTINHVALPNESANTTTVAMTTLDTALAGRDPAVIKVDVEGFESSVIEGASNTLGRKSLIAVIMETNGSGARYSVSDDALHEKMIAAGFTACTYDPFMRRLEKSARRPAEGNTIFVLDFGLAATRVKSAQKFNIAGRSLL